MWCWRRALTILWTEKVANVRVLKSVDETILIKSIAERRSDMTGHRLHHSNWFTVDQRMIEGTEERKGPDLSIWMKQHEEESKQ